MAEPAIHYRRDVSSNDASATTNKNRKMKIVTTAFPFVPVKLGIQHFASTYLPADIYTRALRLIGEQVYFVNATDFHSIYATKNGVLDSQLCQEMHKSYIQNYDTMDIRFDNIITTDDQIHLSTVKTFIKSLEDASLLFDKQSAVYYCNNCKLYLPKLLIEHGKDVDFCKFCNHSDITMSLSNHKWMKISGEADIVKEYAERYTQSEIVKLTQVFLKSLNDWDFTRDNKFGLSINDNLTLYLWFESLVGYYSLVPNEYRSDMAFVHFIGKNIIYYHTVIWPIMLNVVNKQATIDVSARGFMSQSSHIETDVNYLCNKYGTDAIRFYCAYKVKDTIQDFCLDEGEIKEIIKKLINGPINFVNRVVGLATKVNVAVLKVDPQFVSKIKEAYILDIVESYKKGQINRALKKILKFSSYANKLISELLLTKNTTLDSIIYVATTLAILLSPIIPKIANEMIMFKWDKPLLLSDLDDILHSAFDPKFVKI